MEVLRRNQHGSVTVVPGPKVRSDRSPELTHRRALVRRSPRRWGVATLIVALVATTGAVAAPPDPSPQPSVQLSATQRAAEVRFFESKVRPLLAANCYKCHGEKEQESELRLDTWSGMRGGGSSGPAVVPGRPKASLLLTAVEYKSDDLQMPPDKKLTQRQINLLRQWIQRGAIHPNAGAAAPKPRRVNIELGRKHWSFRPLAPGPLPAVKRGGWPRNEIDYYVLARLEQAGLSPAPPADRRTWIRRVTFDLLGLPPTPEEVESFVADRRPGAFRRVVDRLLASPHYGERWGRHWLDVARYADSNGLDENIAHGNAWRYRDYVIAALNEDIPFDRFVVQQLAGDLLPATEDRREAHRRLIATGFLSLGPKVLAEVDQRKMEMDIIDEQVDTVGRALLGLTLGCARCHDHKFDPITTRDYYALAGIFKSTKTMEHYVKIARWNEHAIPTPAQRAATKQHQAQVDAAGKEIAQVVEAANRELQAARPDGKLPAKPESHYPPETRQRLKTLRDAKAKLEKTPPPIDSAMGVGERDVVDLPVHIRGSHLTLGEVVARRLPEVLAGSRQASFPKQHSGRLELARWITADSNPLSPRVLANRVWRWHFGAGLSRSPDNFGTLGKEPDHPRLLDYLAVRLRRDGWSLKQLHRLIVLSSTYRMSSRFNSAAARRDPENRLLWRFRVRRLEAEAFRDAMLAVSGKLDRTQGGSLLHVKNREFFFDHTSKDKTSYDSRRRSVYLPVVRNHLYDVFQLFDYADASVSLGDRATTTVAPQAMFLMNARFTWDAARSWSERLTAEAEDPKRRLERAYREAYGRPPSASERTRMLAFLERYEREHPPAAVARQTQRERRKPTPTPTPAAEPAVAGATQPGSSDKSPQDAAPTPAPPRAWTVLCHALLASNEFAYLR